MRGLPRTFWFLFAGALVNRLGGFIFIYLALYLTQERHFSVEEAGLMVSLHGLGSMASGPSGGWLADRIGRRRTLAIATTLGAAAMLQLGFARAPLHLAASTFMLGYFGDLYRPAIQATVADVVPPAQRTRAYGYLYWAVNLGFSGAAVLAGFLANWGFMLLFAIDAGTTLIFGAIIFLNVPETLPARVAGDGRDRNAPAPGFSAPFRDREFLAFAFLQFLLATVILQCTVALPVDMRAHGLLPRTYGELIAVNGVLIVLLQPIALRVVQRHPRGRVLAVGAVMTGVGFGLAALGATVPIYTASIVVWTLGEITLSPIAPSVVADLAPPEVRGSYQGVFQLSWGVASCVAPAVGSLVLGHLGGRAVWLGCLLVGCACAPLQLLAARARRRRLLAVEDHDGARREDGGIVISAQ